jgi:hypothetical protein
MRTIIAIALLAGCVEPVDAVVAECRSDARVACDTIGYGGNETCLLAFAQECSEEDASAANAACCASVGLPPGSDCRLVWR